MTIPAQAIPNFVTKLAENGPAVLIAGAAAYFMFRQYSQGVNRMFDFLSKDVMAKLEEIRQEIKK